MRLKMRTTGSVVGSIMAQIMSSQAAAWASGGRRTSPAGSARQICAASPASAQPPWSR
jgi:hypothetical protein